MKPIENTPIGKEILKITSNDTGGVNYVKHKFILHTVNNDIPIQLTESFEILRDYNSNTSDYIIATFLMPAGDYIKDIYPFRDNLNLTVIKTIAKKKYRYTYKFVMINNNMNISGTRYTQSTREELNKLEQVRLVGQCVDRVTEALRMKYVSGIYHNTNLETVIKTSMLTAIRTSKSVEGDIDIHLSLSEIENKRTYDHIKIDTGVSVLDLPTFLQRKEYGLYNGDIGTYVQLHEDVNRNEDRYPSKKHLYVYPLYSNNLFDKSQKKLIIYGVSSAKFDFVENTYRLDGDVLSIISGASTSSIDDGGNQLLDDGVGFTSTVADKIMERNNIVSDDGVLVDKDFINSGSIDKARVDSSNMARHIGAQSNLFKYRSMVVRKTMMVYQIQWNHCDPDLIFPGMAVMFVYMDNVDGLVKLKGTVQSLYIMYNEGSNTVTSLLNIAVEKPHY